MPSQAAPVSFDDIIKAGRERKKNEALANEIFGRGRRQSAPGGVSGNRKGSSTPSLASRVGVAKRTASGTKPKANINGQWIHDLHDEPPARGSTSHSKPSRLNKDNRLYSALQAELNVRGSSNGMSIRGSAGPFTVVASNFAPGTTASDIEASMAPIGGEITYCELVGTHPTVMAEIDFAEKSGAENVIATFDNQRADGRLLHVRMKARASSPRRSTDDRAPKTRSMKSADPPRSQADRERRRADANIEDGRYGFDEPDTGRGLYSDEMVSGRRRTRG